MTWRVTFIHEQGGFAFLVPDIADGCRIEAKDGKWLIELELPGDERWPVTTFRVEEGKTT